MTTQLELLSGTCDDSLVSIFPYFTLFQSLRVIENFEIENFEIENFEIENFEIDILGKVEKRAKISLNSLGLDSP